MATYTKFNQFVEDLVQKVHDLFGTAGSGADTLKVMLSNTAPNTATHVVRGDVTELSTSGGYTSGGQSAANAGTRTTTTVTVTGTNVTWTASGGGFTFQYVILYNDTPTSPADPLVCYWDYGSALVMAAADTFTVKFNNGASSGTIFTLA